MSRSAAENAELLRRGYERWNATGRLPTELLDPEIEWNQAVGDTRAVRGLDQAVAAMDEFLQSFEYMQNEPEQIVADGDLVVVVSRTTVRGRGSGIDLTNRAAHVWTLRNGQAVRLEVYEDVDAALRLVGISS